jgi:hypothetical protein
MYLDYASTYVTDMILLPLLVDHITHLLASLIVIIFDVRVDLFTHPHLT